MPFPKEAIKEILQSLDHANDALWTDDGSPLVAEVQRLGNDLTITRAQINEAFPGFARKTSDSVAEDEQPDDEVTEGSGGIVGGVNLTTETIAPITAAAEDVLLSPELEQERLRQIAYKRVLEAEQAITDARDGVSKAYDVVAQAEKRHTRALLLFSSKYPPLTAAANIKLHLARQQEILREKVTGSRFEQPSALSPIEARLMGRKRVTPTMFIPLAVGG